MTTATTFFGNRARLNILHTWTGGMYTFTTGSASFTGSASAGDYVWAAADGVQAACQVTGAGTLAYPYLGAGGAGVAGYDCTPQTLSVLRGLECNISWEAVELYGTDSVLRVDEARHSVKVETKMKYSKWDSAMASDWMMQVLAPTANPTTGAIQDTNVHWVEGVVYTIPGATGEHLEIVAGRSYFEGLPLPIPENDFLVRDITGHAVSANYHSY